MIVWIIHQLTQLDIPVDAYVQGLTFRSLFAGLGLLLATLACGPAAIRWLSRHCREPIKSGSAQLDRMHAAKAATPTMGGLFLVCGIVAAVGCCCDMANPSVLAAVATVVGLTFVGAVDDLIKLWTAGAGLRWKQKLFAQICAAGIPAIALHFVTDESGAAERTFGLYSSLPASAAIAWSVLVVVAAANAVNLTDGLDGLAAGCLLLPATVVALAAAFVCHGAPRELIVVAAAMIGAVLGFLRFNRHPARVFLGNVGALPLGGLLGFIAVTTGTELLLLVAGGVFVAEALSVILQVGSFRLTGKRVLRCAPLHHHFEFLGWREPTIVNRFWCASAACAAAGLLIVIALQYGVLTEATGGATHVAARTQPLNTK